MIYETGVEAFDVELPDAMLDPENGMARPAVLTSFGTDRNIFVVFRAPFIALTNLGQEFNDVQPLALARNSDLGDARKGDVLTIGSNRWKILAIEPLGAGLSRLRLQGPIGDV